MRPDPVNWNPTKTSFISSHIQFAFFIRLVQSSVTNPELIDNLLPSSACVLIPTVKYTNQAKITFNSPERRVDKESVLFLPFHGSSDA